MTPWYCVQTYPKKEAFVKQRLEHFGYLAFSPVFLVRSKCRHVERRQLFAGYVLVSLPDPAYWPRIKNIECVAGVLTHRALDPRPSGNVADNDYFVPSMVDRSIDMLRAQALSHDEIRRGGKPRPEAVPTTGASFIHAGCCVRIKEGPLKPLSDAQKPIVVWTDGERAMLLLHIFGRPSEVEFYLRDLELVAAA